MLNDICYFTTAALQLIMLLPPRVNSDWGGIGSPICPLPPPPHTWGGEEMPTPVEWVLHALQRKQRT